MSIQTAYTPLLGSEDLTTPPIKMNPGRALLAHNYEPSVNGGFCRVAGYAKYDGDPATQLAVPGEGDVLGVWVYNGDVYAFRNAIGGASALMYKSTPSGWAAVTTPTLNPGGRYEFVNYNFGGHSGSVKMYGVNGVDQAFEFDGTTFTQISTGMTTDTPNHIAAHKNYLFLSFPGGSLQNSPLADPTGTWTPVVGASEVMLGDEITNIVPVPGGNLAITGRNSTYVLYGTPGTDLELRRHSETAGGFEYTAQFLDGVKVLNDNGLIDLRTTEQYGDFDQGAFTDLIRPLIHSAKGSAVASMVVRAKNQYRLFTSSGLVIIAGWGNGELIGFTRQQLLVTPTCATSGFIANTERLFIGATDGCVYEMDTGTSYDGANIESLLRLPFNHMRKPRIRKRFRKIVLEMVAGGQTSLQYQVEYDYGDPDVKAEPLTTATVGGQGGLWNIANWDEFVWNGELAEQPEASIAGSGNNIALVIYNSANDVDPFCLQGIMWHYSERRVDR